MVDFQPRLISGWTTKHGSLFTGCCAPSVLLASAERVYV